MSEALRFLIAVQLVGLAALPLAQLGLGRLSFGGAGFAKPLGFLLLGWLVWVGTVLGLRNDLWLIFGAAVVLVAAGAGALIALRRGGGVIPWKRVLAFDAGFAVAFAACTVLNAFSPGIYETEKPMDMAIVNATIASPGHPPHDPWVAGEDLNYYYLGHFAVGVFIRLTDVEPSAGYNVALAAVFGFVAVAAAGLAAALGRELGARPWHAGAAGLVLVLLAGTPGGGAHALLRGSEWREFPWFSEAFVVEGTINDFPAFSFILGDLHAHVIAGPLSLVALAFVVQVAIHGPPRGRSLLERGLTAVCIGTLFAVNAWSFPVVAGLFALAVLLHAREQPRRALIHAATVLGPAAIAVAPFVAEFESIAGGVGLVSSREGLGDFLWHHGKLYGTFAWILAAVFLAEVALLRSRRRLPWALLVAAGGLLLLARADLAGAGLLVLLLLVALHTLFSARRPLPERAVWLLVTGALVCLVLPEVVYVRDDLDGTRWYRMNTVFKLGYHAWYLLAVAAAVVLVVAGRRLPRPVRLGWAGGALAILLVALAFPVVGSYSRKGGFDGSATLDGRRWLPEGDVAAIDWVRANTDGDAVIAQAAEETIRSPNDTRISTFTGRPAVVGSEHHARTWGYDLGTRRLDVRRLYTSTNRVEVTELLEQLGVDFAVVGARERAQYGEPWTLAELGRKVFERAGTAVYAFD